jgi:hypothetical protein
MLCSCSCNIAGLIGLARDERGFAISGALISNANVAPAARSKANTPANKVILDIGYSALLKVPIPTLERMFLL